MGLSLYESRPEARALYDLADRELGYSLTQICFEGPADRLQLTKYAQPALLVTELAHLAALRAAGRQELASASFVAGHSLGEYSALVAGGALDFRTALRLVAERGRLMQEAGASIGEPSGMAAIIGLADDQLAAVCAECGVDLANLNAPGQAVMSGPVAALEAAGNRAREKGARRVVPLQVSASFHSRWMRPVAEQFSVAIARAEFSDPTIPVIANVTAGPVRSSSEIRDLLVRQTYSPVRWVESVKYIAGRGVTTFIEIGPGKVLSGLVKRIEPDARVLSSEDLLA